MKALAFLAAILCVSGVQAAAPNPAGGTVVMELRATGSAVPDETMRADMFKEMLRRIEAAGGRATTIAVGADGSVRIEALGAGDGMALPALLAKDPTFGLHEAREEDEFGPPPDTASEAIAEQSSANPPRRYVIKTAPVLTKADIESAKASFDERTGGPVVSIVLTPDGRERFAEFSRAHVGRMIAMVVDGTVISAPVIAEPVTGGQLQIAGRFTVAAAEAMAASLSAPPLPYALSVAEVR